MLIGGQAVLLYGEPRLTRDIDITLGIEIERLPEILGWVSHCGWQTLALAPAAFVRDTLVLPCLDPRSDLRLDFIFSSSEYERQAFNRVRRLLIGKAEVCFCSIEDLIIHKVIAGRPRDLEDVRGVLFKAPALDLAYLHHWLQAFDQSLHEPFLDRFESIRKSVESA